jgi:hypothetical protein
VPRPGYGPHIHQNVDSMRFEQRDEIVNGARRVPYRKYAVRRRVVKK